MIEETGKVVAQKGDQVWVQVVRESACQSCSARSACGQRVLAGISGGRASQVMVDNDLGVVTGDEVVLGVGEQALLTASVLVYLLPLLLMGAGAVMADLWLPSGDLWPVLGGALGLVAGFGGGAWFQHRHRRDARFQPKLLRRAPTGERIPVNQSVT